MTEPERRRLARILGMLGSEHAGERASAALQAEAFRKRHNMTWEQMLALPAVETAPERSKPAPEPAPEPEPPPPPPRRPKVYLFVHPLVMEKCRRAFSVAIIGVIGCFASVWPAFFIYCLIRAVE